MNKETLNTMDNSIKNLKEGRVGKPINLEEIAKNLMDQEDIPADFAQVLNDHFFELL